MKKSNLTQRVLLGLLLILLSVFFYSLHFVIFRDSHHIFIYLLGDIAFVFIEVLLVTLIIHHLLLVREWLSHMEHLKVDYPYLFSLAVRTNPFDPNASAEVE
jgi:hypothetical protein